jgi:putative phosphonate metabolism protein
MRFAVYFAPPADSDLAVAGARWLGRDAYTDARLPQPMVEGIAYDRIEALTTDPRRYGFHATLKAPFTLAGSETVERLSAAFADFARQRAAFPLPLKVDRLGDFLALVPAGPSAELDRLAADCVTAFDPFRAPSPPDDLARRRLAGLTPRQDELLQAFGYPYVFEEFRFHMTLSQRVFGDEADRLQRAAETHFADLLRQPVPVDTLALFVEPSPGTPFTVAATASLAA